MTSLLLQKVPPSAPITFLKKRHGVRTVITKAKPGSQYDEHPCEQST